MSKGNVKALVTVVAYGVAISAVLAHKLWKSIRPGEEESKKSSDSDDVVDAPHKGSEESPQSVVEKDNVREVSVLERAVRAFLSSTQLDGYVTPFLEIDEIKQLSDPEQTANAVNQAMCIIRYLSKSDPVFCRGALSRMIEAIREEGAITVREALSLGAEATCTTEFQGQFEKNPHDKWKHIYIMSVHDEASRDEFCGMLLAMFNTVEYSYPSALIKEAVGCDGGVAEWAKACGIALKSQDLVLAHLECYHPDGDPWFGQEINHYVLLKPLEYQALCGMLEAISVSAWVQRVE